MPATTIITPDNASNTQPPAPVEERLLINHYLNGQIRIEAQIARLPLTLYEHLGRNILQICPHRYHAKNHCAHWVSHVLGYNRLGCPACKTMSKTPSKPDIGVLIRVDEIYNAARQKQSFINALPPGFHQGLIYVTRKGNMKPSGEMNTGPAKHIGIWYADKVWHYSNRGTRVVHQSMQQFQKTFTKEYGGGGRYPIVFFCSDFRGNFQ